jgi:hypothetical protein
MPRKPEAIVPFCIDCKWFREVPFFPTCTNPETARTDLVWGFKPVSADFARGIERPCGPEGNLWRQK